MVAHDDRHGSVIRVADLPANRTHAFDLRPAADARDAIAERLGLLQLRKIRFSGELRPEGRQDWTLVGVLRATVVQSCVVTLEPVVTPIEASVERRYIRGFSGPEGSGEYEMPQDELAEPLGDTIDLALVMEEALALELPPYPRAPGAELTGAQVTEPGKAPMTDDDARPFAALKGLRDKLRDEED